MAALRDVAVPDIGDFADVPVIEVLVSVGQSVAAEEALLTLESDKATMDVPAPFDGTVKEILVDVGDRVSQGTVVMRFDGANDRALTEERPGTFDSTPWFSPDGSRVVFARVGTVLGCLFVGSWALACGLLIWTVSHNENPLAIIIARTLPE